MKNTEKPVSALESILIALDQISQTVDVINIVVERLRDQLLKQNSFSNMEMSSEVNHISQDTLNQTIH